MRLFQIEKRVKRKEFDGFNFVLERGRLQIMLEEMEGLILKN